MTIEARITDPVTINTDEIRLIVESGRTPTVQFSKAGYTPALLQAVNRICAELEDHIEVRFFGHYGDCFDASVLAQLPNARWVSIDCLPAIKNEQQIASLPLLNRLSFGVYTFDNPKFLETIDVSQLKRLSLGETLSRNIDLGPLNGAPFLHTVWLDGHTKNIEVLSTVPRLRTLTLRAFPKRKDSKFLSGAVGLRSLALTLGGRAAFNEFGHATLEELSVIRVRGLETLGSLNRFPRLETLRIEDQAQIRSIDFSGASLRKITLDNCQRLMSVDGLECLSNLRELNISRTKLDLEDLATRDWTPSLNVLALYSASRKWNDATRAMLDKRGYRESATRDDR